MLLALLTGLTLSAPDVVLVRTHGDSDAAALVAERLRVAFHDVGLSCELLTEECDGTVACLQHATKTHDARAAVGLAVTSDGNVLSVDADAVGVKHDVALVSSTWKESDTSKVPSAEARALAAALLAKLPPRVVAVPLVPLPRPPWKPSLRTRSLVGGAVGVTVIGAVFLGVGAATQGQLNRAQQSSMLDPIDAQRLQRQATGFFVASLVAGVIAAGLATTAVFVGMADYRAWADPTAASR